MTSLELDLNQSLDLRIAQFKNDADKMRDVNDFLGDLFDKAQKEAEKRNGSAKQKGKLMEQKKSKPGRTALERLQELLHPEFLPQFAIVPIQCGVLLLLATIVIRKYLKGTSNT